MLEGMGVEGMQDESSLDILPREENVGERAGLARLALLGEREADLGEEALDRRRDVSSSSATGSFFFFLPFAMKSRRSPDARSCDGPELSCQGTRGSSE